MRKLDVTVLNEGTVVLFTPVSDDARQWFDEHVEVAEWQRFGENGIAVDRRYAENLLAGIKHRGLRVQVVL